MKNFTEDQEMPHRYHFCMYCLLCTENNLPSSLSIHTNGPRTSSQQILQIQMCKSPEKKSPQPCLYKPACPILRNSSILPPALSCFHLTFSPAPHRSVDFLYSKYRSVYSWGGVILSSALKHKHSYPSRAMIDKSTNV